MLVASVRSNVSKFRGVLAGAVLLGAAGFLAFGAAHAADQVVIGLITKTNTNPFFVKMKEGAEKGAAAAGVALQSFAGEKDGDAAPQITAIENCVAAGVKGILITPSNDDVGPALKAARAKGILVISLDTPLGDKEGQDMTFATDNFEAGIRIGKWALGTLGDKAKDQFEAVLGPALDEAAGRALIDGLMRLELQQLGVSAERMDALLYIWTFSMEGVLTHALSDAQKAAICDALLHLR